MKSNPLENIFYFFRDRFVFPWIRIHNLACRLHLLQTQLSVSGRDESSLTGGISRAGWCTYNLACRLLYNCLCRKGRVQFDDWHFTSRLVDPQPCLQIAVQLSVQEGTSPV